MRKTLIKQGDEHLRYEIREIVEIANEVVGMGVPMIWENIGDPVAKGERIPDWMKAVVQEAAADDRVYQYSPTKGELSARQFVVDHYSDSNLCSVDDVIFLTVLATPSTSCSRRFPAMLG